MRRTTLKLVLALLILCPWASAQEPAPSAHPFFDIATRRMDVDVDGAPNAYGPAGTHPLDELRNAHYRRRKHAEIVGYLTDDNDPTVPIIQGPHDPYPGLYISQTAYTDPALTDPKDPRRYVDATCVNYIVLGDTARKRGARLGDFVAVHSNLTHKSVFGIVADDGNPSGNEGSLHLLQDLGYPFKNGIDDAVEHHGEIIVRFFPNSNPAQLFFRTQAALNAAALKLGLSRDFRNPPASNH